MKLYNVLEAYEKLMNRSLEISRLYNYLTPQNGNITNSTISFERFCAFMAEFSSTDGCNMCSTDGRVYYSALYWTCALLKTRYLLKSFVLRPIMNALGIAPFRMISYFFFWFVFCPSFFVWLFKSGHSIVCFSFSHAFLFILLLFQMEPTINEWLKTTLLNRIL